MQAIENGEQVSKSEVLSQPQRKKQPKSTASRAAPQENNPFGKIDQLDPSQVVKYKGLDPSVVHQENNLNRKIDLPLQPSSSHEPVPLVPSPFDDTSWLAKKIEELLNKKSRMTTSQFKFEVNTEAASSNFNKLAENDFDLEGLLNPTERCATTYGSEFKDTK